MLQNLRYLAALARERHFGRAAAACHVSQPTLSAGIHRLESDLGAAIIARGNRYLGLTSAGEIALEHAHRMLAEAEALRTDLSEHGKGLVGRLRVGAVPTALPLVAPIAAPFYRKHPEVTVTVLSLTSQEIVRGIEQFDLDIGLTYLDNEPLPKVRTKPVHAEEYAFLTSIDGPYAKLSQITWAQAAQAPLCLLTPDMQNRRIIDGIFRSVGANPKPMVETNSIFNLVAHTNYGPWSSIVPRQLLSFFGVPEGTRAVELIEPKAMRTLGLIMSAQEPPPPLARHFFDLPRIEGLAGRIKPAGKSR